MNDEQDLFELVDRIDDRLVMCENSLNHIRHDIPKIVERITNLDKTLKKILRQFQCVNICNNPAVELEKKIKQEELEF